MKGLFKFIWWLVTILVAISCTFIGTSIVLKGCADTIREATKFF